MKVLITRLLGEDSLLQKWCNDHNITLVESPFISTESVQTKDLPSTDWIFFTSPKGAKHYLDQHSIDGRKIGVIGEGTTRALSKYNLTPDFAGNSTNTENVGEAFKELIKDQTVLFPIGNKSLKRIQGKLDPRQIKEVLIYTTISLNKAIPEDVDIIICSSPSNGEGLKKSGLAKSLPLIAFGKATAAYLKKELNQNKVVTLTAFNEEAIVQALETLQ